MAIDSDASRLRGLARQRHPHSGSLPAMVAAITDSQAFDIQGTTSPVSNSGILSRGEAPIADTGPSGLVFIDARVADLNDLLNGLRPGEAAFVLNGDQDGLQQIAWILADGGYHDLASIAIVAHGAEGTITLGATTLTLENLQDNAAPLATIGSALFTGGDLLLYGCDIAAGETGQQFIEEFSRLTGGVSVAAATHMVGDDSDGGSWTLDVETGSIEAEIPFTTEALINFDGVLGDTLTATQATVLTTDVDGDGIVDPGDTVTTTVTITNDSVTTAATGVSFNENLNGMTLVAGKINVSPLAFDDSFTAVGNTQLIVNASGVNPGATPAAVTKGNLFTNDVEFLGDSFSLKSFTQGTNGAVTVNSDGTFTYTPTAGFSGNDTFTYTLTDKGLDGVAGTGDDLTSTGAVKITVGSVVWYVDSTAVSNGTGTSTNPFNVINASTLNGVGDKDGAGDYIYLKGSGTYTGPLTLETSQHLIGSAAALTVGGFTLAGASGGARPTLSATSGTTLTLASGNEVAGVSVTNSNGNGIAGSAVGTLTLADFSASISGGTALGLSGGGTVTATGTNTLTATTGTALSVTNVNIGAGNLKFQSISAGSSSGSSGNGITLDTTGSAGGLIVTGVGTTAGSGGTIQHKTGSDLSRSSGIGIYLNSTANVSLSNMQLNDFDNFAIRGFNVNNFTLDRTVINGVNGTNATNNGADDAGEGAVYFGNTVTSGLTGNVSLTNGTFSGGRGRNVSNTTTSGTLHLTVDQGNFGLNQNVTGANQALLVEARGIGTTVNTTLTNSTFAGAPGDDVNFTGQTGTIMNVTMKNNTLANTHAGNIIGGGGLTLATQGKMVFNVDNNKLSGAHGSAVTMFLAKDGTALEGTFQNNTIGTSGVAGSGSKTGNGIFLSAAGAGTITLAILNNMIQQYAGNAGMYMDNTGGSYGVNLTITGNTTRQPGAGAFAGLALTNGSPSSGDTTNVFARILNNDFSAGDPANANDIIIGASGSSAVSHTFTLSGASAADVASLAAIQTFLKNNNNLNSASANTVATAYTDSPVTVSAFKATSSLPPLPGTPATLIAGPSSVASALQATGEDAPSTPPETPVTPASIMAGELAIGPVAIGTLPFGRTVTIQYQATIDPQTNQLILTPINSGTVTSSFPTTNTNTVTTTLDTLVLGNQIFNDANRNGVFDAGDSGIGGVDMTLFADTGATAGSFDGGDTAIATTKSSGAGTWSFAGLAPGSYIVRVDAGNFTGGGALASFRNDLIARDTTPNNNIDSDNNGNAKSSGFVVSNAITLSYNNEPVAGTGNDSNTSLDLGFALNRAPVLGADTAFVQKGATSSGTAGQAGTGVLGNDSDPDGDALTVSAVSNVVSGAGTPGSSLTGKFGHLTLNADGSYSYQADLPTAIDAAAAGSHPLDVFNYSDSDGLGGTAGGTLTITINRVPIVVKSTASAVKGGTINATAGTAGTGALGGDSDPDGDTLTITALTGGTLGVALKGSFGDLTLQADGSYTYVAGSVVGTDVFTYTVSDGQGGTTLATLELTTPCYCPGTLIATPEGEVAVEALRIGDHVRTARGTNRPITWIGWRHLDLTRHPRPALARPIRIRADAFADGVPSRDLRVSPEHAIYVDGVLIPARLLVNHASIAEDTTCAQVTYFHIELDAHDILLAEGLPAESYLDTGNRGLFENAGLPLILHPDLSGQAQRQAQSCAPFADTPEQVEPVWRRLADRAELLGLAIPAVATTDDPEPRIVAAGRTLRPVTIDGDRYIFVLPEGCDSVRLLSRSAVPAALAPWREDRRSLGLAVRRIRLCGAGDLADIPLDHPALTMGWWDVERHGGAIVRWTDGSAMIRVGDGQSRLLEVTAGRLDAYGVEARERAA